MDRPLLLALLITCMALCSCADGAGDQRSLLAASADSAAPPALQAALPALPQDSFVHIAKATAALDAQLPGRDFISASPGVSVNGSTAQFISGDGGLEFAIYRFTGSAGEAIGSISASVNGLDGDELLYLAISDYSTGRWFFLPPQASSSQSSELDNASGRWVSPQGNTYIAAIGFGAGSFELQSLSLRYLDRFSITGQVVDQDGNPLADVFVASMFAGLSDTTDGNGNFLLSGLPEGSWPVAATADGWTFYDQPALVTVDGSDGEVTIVGHRGGSNFTVRDTLPGNNLQPGPQYDIEGGPLEDCIAAIDDPVDFYTFNISEPGHYYLLFEDLSGEIGITYIILHSLDRFANMLFSPEVLDGSYAMGFNVYGDPLSFVLEFRCFSGGGDYRISLIEGQTHPMAVKVFEDGSFFSSAELLVEHPELGETRYFGRSNGAYTFLDYSRPPGQTTITPLMDGYSFSPPSSVQFFNSARLDLEFEAVSGTFPDSLEPNNVLEEAQPLVLPYLEEDELSVGDSDSEDWYRFTPPPGKGLEITVRTDENLATLGGMGLSLLDSSGQLLQFPDQLENVYTILPDYLSDGSEYFLRVGRSDKRRFSYHLTVRAYDPTELRFGVQVDGELVNSQAVFELLDADFSNKITLFPADDASLTAPLYVESGTVFNVECMRYGLSVHRQTKKVVVGGSVQEVLFEAPDWGTDDHEPNGPDDPRPLLSAPFTVSATSESRRDADFYRMEQPGTKTYSLTLDSEQTEGLASLTVSNPLGEQLLSENLRRGQTVHFNSADEEFIDIRLKASLRELDYSLSVEEDEAYSISGRVSREIGGGGSISNAVIFIRETGRSYKTDIFGSFETHLLPPGTYTIVMLAIGYEPAYVERSVVIDSAPLEENFEGLVIISSDDYEPNNNIGQAHLIELDEGYVASCGDLVSSGGDDWYVLDNAPAGTKVQFMLNAEDISSLSAEIFMDSEEYSLGEMYKLADGLWLRDAVLPETADYYIRIRGTGGYALVPLLVDL